MILPAKVMVAEAMVNSSTHNRVIAIQLYSYSHSYNNDAVTDKANFIGTQLVFLSMCSYTI